MEEKRRRDFSKLMKPIKISFLKDGIYPDGRQRYIS
jgi:hypothetical protein